MRGHAERLQLDFTHFTGQRRWTEEQLRDAVRDSRTWAQVAQTLGLAGGSSTATLKGHAVRLGLDIEHLTSRNRIPMGSQPEWATPDVRNIARAGSLLAAGWYQLCGADVSWPLEPCAYDLITWRDGQGIRVQVKTGTVRSGNSFTVWISSTSPRREPYDVDAIDEFFIIDGALSFYVIPIQVVGGLSSINLAAYESYRVPQLTPGLARASGVADRNIP